MSIALFGEGMLMKYKEQQVKMRMHLQQQMDLINLQRLLLDESVDSDIGTTLENLIRSTVDNMDISDYHFRAMIRSNLEK